MSPADIYLVTGAFFAAVWALTLSALLVNALIKGGL